MLRVFHDYIVYNIGKTEKQDQSEPNSQYYFFNLVTSNQYHWCHIQSLQENVEIFKNLIDVFKPNQVFDKILHYDKKFSIQNRSRF